MQSTSGEYRLNLASTMAGPTQAGCGTQERRAQSTRWSRDFRARCPRSAGRLTSGRFRLCWPQHAPCTALAGATMAIESSQARASTGLAQRSHSVGQPHPPYSTAGLTARASNLIRAAPLVAGALRAPRPR